MIGLSGANGTGKSTLAKEFARHHDIPVVLTSASNVYQSLGLDPAVDYPMHTRIGIQETILSAFEIQYSNAAKRTPLFITDRTPIDLASYMLADVQRSTLAGQDGVAEMVNGYLDRCFQSANRWFSVILLVQPGIPVAMNREGKAMSCPAFMEHLNAIQAGCLIDKRLEAKGFTIPRNCLDIGERVQAIGHAWANAFEGQSRQVEQLKLAGRHLH